MTDYLGRLIFDETEMIGVTAVMSEGIILEEDSDDFVDSYAPAEGCTEEP